MSISARRLMRTQFKPSALIVSGQKADASTVLVSWSTAANPAGGWTVGRDGTDNNNYGPWSTVLAGTARSQSFGNLKPSAIYTFSVNGGGLSGAVVVNMSTGSETPPTGITSSIVNNGGGSVTLQWVTATSPTGGWTVGRDGVDSNGSGAWSTTLTDGAARQFTFSNLVTGNTYNLTVSGGGVTSTSTITIAPDPLTNFTGLATSDTAVRLTWSYSGPALNNFTLTRGGTVIATVPAGVTSYDDTGLTAGTSYAYQLTGNVQGGGTTNTASASVFTTGGTTTGSWLSGASIVEVEQYTSTSSPFGQWRGTPVACASTWADGQDSYDIMTGLAQFNPGGNYYNWDTSIDIAPGAIIRGHNWGMAAAGDAAIVNAWTAFLNNLKAKWNRIPRGNCFIRFAHEMNGNWYSWSVNDDDVGNFILAWRRFRELQKNIFPEAKLVFNTNANSVGHNYDWRTIWPGDGYVDVYSVDFYGWHYANNPQYDGNGGPAQFTTHREFALAHGKPIAIPEWGTASDRGGDLPSYIQFIHDMGVQYGGTGPGNLIYENYFNVDKPGDVLCQLYPSTTNPGSAARYQQIF